MPLKRIDFKQFWDAYPIHRNRIVVERVWKQMSAKDRSRALAGIDAYRDDCQQQGVAMMYGEGYLKYRRWEDERECTILCKQSEQARAHNSPSTIHHPLSTTDPLTEMEIW